MYTRKHLTMNNQELIRSTCDVLQKGGTILYPTDTIWGLGCDARNEQAVDKIIELKKRPEGKSFIILLDNENKLDSYVKEVPQVAWELIEYSERPLTLILPGAKNLAKNVINEDGSVAIRIVKAGFAHELIKRYRYPVVSTSANVSGEPSAKTLDEISDELINHVDLVCHAPDTGTGNASVIIRLELNGQFSFLRK
jgi:L-threonylcarbamoyladenylate synthase